MESDKDCGERPIPTHVREKFDHLVPNFKIDTLKTDEVTFFLWLRLVPVAISESLTFFPVDLLSHDRTGWQGTCT